MNEQTFIHPIEPISKLEQNTDIPMRTIPKNTIIIVLSAVTIIGVLTGATVAILQPKTSKSSNVSVIDSSGKNPQSAGVLDKQTFTDSATGVLRDGGFEGEGSHHLERGAKDQTAYLTSSTIDMQPFVGKKVKVWGQTHTSEKVGWFMDIGYIEISK